MAASSCMRAIWRLGGRDVWVYFKVPPGYFIYGGCSSYMLGLREYLDGHYHIEVWM